MRAIIKPMKTLLLAAVAFGLAASGFAESADEAAVRAAHASFVAAAKAGDVAALGKLLADGLQYSHSSGAKPETKAQALASMAKSKGNFEVHDQTIHVYGNAATIRASITAHNATGDVPLKMLLVWVKNGKDWQMVERHTTRIAPSASKK